MKEEYDFTNAEQGKFYIPLEEIEAPIYLDKDVARFFADKLKGKNETLQSLINELLRKDIEIANRVSA
ncbi:hypothetical protein [Sulfuricurvum sp.]|uniref:hypothetical protein n=1 Tax=Sulfuricurvum sp. TaxID=2025608 RepID=UPI0025D734C2|nr:hypothetical protein [Sulfuricurvum sp.]